MSTSGEHLPAYWSSARPEYYAEGGFNGVLHDHTGTHRYRNLDGHCEAYWPVSCIKCGAGCGEARWACTPRPTILSDQLSAVPDCPKFVAK